MKIKEVTPTAELPRNVFNYEDYLRFLELSTGMVRLDRVIVDASTSRLLTELSYIQNLGLKKITLSISSPGGNAYSAFAIYDAITKLRKNGVVVEALVEGWAASAAAMIVLQAATSRHARTNARFLLHEARRWIFFSMERTSDMLDEVGEMKAIEGQIMKILSSRCKKTEDEVRKLIERKEVWMSAQEALNWNLIDKIV